MKKIIVEFDSFEEISSLIGMINVALQVKGLDAAAQCLFLAEKLKKAMQNHISSNPVVSDKK